MKNISTLSWIRIIGLLSLVASVLLMVYGSYYVENSKFSATKYYAKIDSVNRALRPKLKDGKFIAKKDWDQIPHKMHEFPKFKTSEKQDTLIVELLPDNKHYSEIIISLDNRMYSSSEEVEDDLKKNVVDPTIANYNPGLFLEYAEDIDEFGTTLTAIGSILFIASVVSFIVISFLSSKEKEEHFQSNLIKAQEDIKQNPDKVMPAWDMAQLTLEQYFQRNLRQINMIFYTSIVVMVAGFFLIFWGSMMAVKNPDKNLIPILTATSGIITQFIGATFIFIYNSTVKQAMSYTESLEKINSVGMSIKILDSIELKEKQSDKLNDAKIEIAKILLHAKDQNIQSISESNQS